MMRLFVPTLVALASVSAPAHAHADCIQTCGDVCEAGDEASFHRVEVVSMTGSDLRVRFVERLGGDPDVGPEVGEERDGVYPIAQVELGAQLFVSVRKFSDSNDEYVGNAWEIRDGNVVCNELDPEVPLAQYVAMATSDSCTSIAEDLEINNTCSDGSASPGCASVTRGATTGTGLALVGVVGLVLARRRRRR